MGRKRSRRGGPPQNGGAGSDRYTAVAQAFGGSLSMEGERLLSCLSGEKCSLVGLPRRLCVVGTDAGVTQVTLQGDLGTLCWRILPGASLAFWPRDNRD
jgi:hypothetical protein